MTAGLVFLVGALLVASQLQAATETEETLVTDNDLPITAEVVLVPPGPTADEPVTSDNVQGHLPTPYQIGRAQSGFARLGFSVGPARGVGFSISANRSTFEKVFNVGIVAKPDGEVRIADAQGRDDLDLPLAALPEDLRELVSAAGFQRPLDFGPEKGF